MSACKRCPIGDGSVWPTCLGPNGCMRTHIASKPEVFHVCLEEPSDDDMEIVAEVLKGGIPPGKISKLYGPRQVRFGNNPPLREEQKGDRNSQKSISVSLPLYNQLKSAAKFHSRSMASIVDNECLRFFEEEEGSD